MYDGPAWEFLRAVMALMYGISWVNVALIIAFIVVIRIIWKLEKDPNNRFDVVDLFLDQRTNKASSSAIIVMVMAGMSVWAVVTLIQRDKPVETILLGVLGIFVAGKAVTSVWGQPQPETTTTSITSTTVSPPTPPDPPVK